MQDQIPDTLITTKRYVLVLYTGGTIGMKPGPNGGLIPSKQIVPLMKIDPWLNDPWYAKNIPPEDRSRVVVSSKIEGPLATKVSEDGVRTVYGVLTFDPLLDSSNMNPAGWTKMAKCIEKYYKEFDGFVILHGTDTMAYTSSALAFMLQGLTKPVIITGSQVPLFQLRTDAEENLKGALILAAMGNIPEVTLLFYNKLMRGCRAAKVNASAFKAFESPNFEPLAEVGVDITVSKNIFPQKGPLIVHEDISSAVGAIRIFPGITTDAVAAFLSNLKGVVLESFGAGNVPDDIVQTLKAAIKRQVLIVNVTQCLEGSVDDSIYAAGKSLLDIGVVPGADMTSEAALTKLAFLLSNPDLTNDKRKTLLKENIRGELTPTKAVTKCDVK